MKNIVLVGFMGTGKTAVGKRIAGILKLKYVSTDDIIEAKEARPINEIFAKDGEGYFRKREKEAVKDASLMKGVVIAAGGGVVLDDENVKLLKETGILVSLKATAEEILERTKNCTHRPLLNCTDPLGKIRELLKKRAPYYKKADWSVNTSGKTVNQVAREIIGIVRDKL